MALDTLTASLKAIFNYNISKLAANKSASRLTDDTDSLSTSHTEAFTFGTGANQANQIFQDSRTLSASASEDLNISGGAHGGAVSLTNPLDEAISFTAIKGLLVRNMSTTGAMRIGGEATNGLTALFGDNSDELVIRAGGCLHIIAPDATGYAVASNEVLQVTNLDGSNSLTYEIEIIGLE